MEIVARVERRRKWTIEEKAALIAEAEAEGGKVKLVARRHRMWESLLYDWRSAWKAAAVAAVGSSDAVEFVPLGVFGETESAVPPMLPSGTAAVKRVARLDWSVVFVATSRRSPVSRAPRQSRAWSRHYVDPLQMPSSIRNRSPPGVDAGCASAGAFRPPPTRAVLPARQPSPSTIFQRGRRLPGNRWDGTEGSCFRPDAARSRRGIV
ncbi:transposase [Acidisphaera sp. S103]|uniref:transposase n=1 Tax=Acidisphaera sp. S103 TaxID=1747223 RepID=UPI00352DBD1B